MSLCHTLKGFLFPTPTSFDSRRPSTVCLYYNTTQHTHPPCCALLLTARHKDPRSRMSETHRQPKPIRLRHDGLKNQYFAISHCSVFNRLCCRDARTIRTCGIDKNTTHVNHAVVVYVCAEQNWNVAAQWWSQRQRHGGDTKTSQILLTIETFGSKLQKEMMLRVFTQGSMINVIW